MSKYGTPGVYVEEVPSALKTIAGVGTSIAGFLGIARKIKMPQTPQSTKANPDYYTVAPGNTPVKITSWEQFKNNFGDIQEGNKDLAHGVYGFFNNGGSECRITRVINGDDALIDQKMSAVTDAEKAYYPLKYKHDILVREKDAMVTVRNSAVTTAKACKDEYGSASAPDTIAYYIEEIGTAITAYDAALDDGARVIALTSVVDYVKCTKSCIDTAVSNARLVLKDNDKVTASVVKIKLESIPQASPADITAVIDGVGFMNNNASITTNINAAGQTANAAATAALQLGEITESTVGYISRPDIDAIQADIGAAATAVASLITSLYSIIDIAEVDESDVALPAGMLKIQSTVSDVCAKVDTEVNTVLKPQFDMAQAAVDAVAPLDKSAYPTLSWTEALDTFKIIDEIALVAAPGNLNIAVQKAVIEHCINMEDRFAILDGQRLPTGTITFDAAAVTTDPADATRKLGNAERGYGALYFPWLKVYDPSKKDEADSYSYVGPSGHMAGIFARSDSMRGVHKAPANEVIRGIAGLEHTLSRNDQAGLNLAGINVIRNFNGNHTVWGARTLADTGVYPEWKYVSARRLFNYIKESIEEGTRWTIFEPNDLSLWAKIRRNVGAFLNGVWRDGGLFGATPEQAFYVKCDEELNPPAVRETGKVIIEIGVALVKPAEFVIFKISQWQGE